MTIKEFIEKAIEGGWIVRASLTHLEILFDPLAWKAVGKVAGWDRHRTYENFIGMAVDLWDGKTTEEYIATL